jgi:hypothetical protein
LPVGAVVYFNQNEEPKSFFFITLENETLVNIDYNEWHGIERIVQDCIYYTAHVQIADTSKEVSLFLYLIEPPRMSFKYSILKKTKATTDFTEVKDINSVNPFVNITLPILLKDENYSIKLDVYDSILNKRSIIYKDVDVVW